MINKMFFHCHSTKTNETS